MGRYNFAAQRVQQHATQLLERSHLAAPPPWFAAVSNFPPSARLTRPPLQKPVKHSRKAASRIFQPLPISYEEDQLRWEYFNDHPWELARPRVVLENDGRDKEKWDWSLELDFALKRPAQDNRDVKEPDEHGRTEDSWDRLWKTQSARPINGESVIQRQQWLMTHRNVSQSAAYDIARKEYYRLRHSREIERRVAREEALAVGGEFGPGPLEIGMKLEDGQYEAWKTWALDRAQQLRHLHMQDSDTSAMAIEEEEVGKVAETGETSNSESS